jgi:TrkA-N domain
MFRTRNLIPVLVAALFVLALAIVGLAGSHVCDDPMCWALSPFEILLGKYILPKDANALLRFAQQAGSLLFVIGGLISGFGVAISAARHDFRVARSRKKRQHTVVCGLGETGMEIVRSMQESGQDVVAIDRIDDTANAAACDHDGIPVIKGDATDIGVLRSAGAPNAKTIIVCTGDDTSNLDVALKIKDLVAARYRRDPSRLTVIAEMREQWLYARLVDHDRHALGSDEVDLQLFNTYDNAARLLIRSLRLPPGPEIEPGAFVVIGFGRLGQQVTLQLIRAAPVSLDAKTKIIVVDRASDQRKVQFLEANPGIAAVADVQFVAADISLDTPQVWGVIKNVVHNRPLLGVAICLRDDQASLYTALGFRRLLDDLARIHVQVYLRLTQHRHLGQFAASTTRMKGAPHRLQIFGEELFQEDFLVKGKLDTLAKAFHNFWFSSPNAKGSPANHPWDELAETFKMSNRRRADLVAIQLWQRGLRLLPMQTPAILPLTDDEIEFLAQLEHRRWSIDRRLIGYVYGEKRSENPPRHPLLVDWHRLPAGSRDWNLNDMRSLPEILAGAGLEIRRDHKILAYDGHLVDAVAKLSAPITDDEPCTVIADADTAEGRKAAELALKRPKVVLWLVSKEYPDRLDVAALGPIWEGAAGWVSREQLRGSPQSPTPGCAGSSPERSAMKSPNG